LAKAKRVHQIAKELGVDSKSIVAKCKAEGVPGIENHMSVVKLGLVETIRQWFSEGEPEDHAAIETTERVDLTKVRKPARRRASKKKATAKAKSGAGEGDASSGADTATAVEEPPAAPPASKPAQAAAPEPGDEQEAEQAAPAPAAEAPEPAKAEAPDKAEAEAESQESKRARKSKAAKTKAEPAEADAEAQAPSEGEAASGEQGPTAVPNVPRRPQVIKPVGEQVKPKAAELRGPKVIRVEEPEPVRAPRPRRQQAERESLPEGTIEGVTRTRGPARGGGVRSTGGDGPGGDGPTRKRRTLSTRRGRSAEAALPTGPTKFSQADLDELDARLKGSTGFVKKRRQDLRKRETSGGGGTLATPAQVGGKVEIAEPITIKSLSAATGIKSSDIVKYLFKKGIMATINSAIGSEAAMEVALEYDIELEVKEQETAEQQVERQFAEREAIDTRPRPPVVTVLGHVDHGKTSLLDKIRKADVAHHEDGGITQHVGAYRVTIEGSDGKEKTVVFLDTPGHAAFTTMRARGARMTDVVVLVVAADDGVMPQTIESINHAKAAGVPIIVALNKSDLPQATEDNVRKIYGQLAEHGLNPSEWGGETEVVKTSAETGEGVTDLLELLDLQAEMLELTADFGGKARGTVIEAEMQPGRGPVARVLVQDGQIKIGDFIVSGRAYGRVRDMTDDRGNSIREAGPATPLELSGIDEVPDAGDKFFVTDSLRRAEDVAMQYRETEREQMLANKSKVTLDNFADAVKAGEVKELRVVLKADVQGSVETLTKSLSEMGNEEVAVKVLHAAVGGITESDVVLADASEAIVVGFHVGCTPAVREIADERDVEIRLYRVIYDLTDDIKAGLEGMLTPETREEEIGQAQVKQVFKIGGLGAVAGCLVTDGSARKDAKVRVIRDGVVVTDNRDVESLRRVKEEVREVRAGTECGVRVANFEDIKPEDQLVFYKVTEVKRKLD